MAKCGVKRGFLTLRDCGTQTNSRCSTCNRPVCGEHMREISGSGYCVECSTREERAGDRVDEDYAFSFRHKYYTSSAYRPLYFSNRRDNYYDEYDARGFDNEDLVEVDYDDADAIDFEDS